MFIKMNTIELDTPFKNINFTKQYIHVNMIFYDKFSHEQVARRKEYTARKGSDGNRFYLAFENDSAFTYVVDHIRKEHPEYIIRCDVVYDGRKISGRVYDCALEEYGWPHGVVIIVLDSAL